ncbi:MAG: hypothetical protein V3W35_06135 [Gemmatimonadota bacterium]
MNSHEEVVGSPMSDVARLASWLRRWMLLVVVLLVAAAQLYRVTTQGQSSWKGGGFGMYAGFHPDHSDIWVWYGDDERPTRLARDLDPPETDVSDLLICAVLSTDICLERVHSGLGDSERITRMEIWELDFDPRNRALSRTLVAEFAPRGGG